MGYKTQAAAAPRHWVIYPEDPKASSGPERIVAMPEEMPAYRKSKARDLAAAVREILNKARDVDGPDSPVWATLQREDVTVMTIMCWTRDSLATVWLRKEIPVFQHWGETMDPDSHDFFECRKLVNKLRTAASELEETLSAQLKESRMGWSAKGLQFVTFVGNRKALEVLTAELRVVNQVKVHPAWKFGKRARAGVGKVSLIVDEQFSFVACLGENLNEHAQFEILRVIDAIIQAGAAGKPTVRWCLLCSEHLAYLVPLRFPNRRFRTDGDSESEHD